MVETRLFTRMAGKITNGATANSPVANPKRGAAPIPIIPQDNDPHNTFHCISANSTSNWSPTNYRCTNSSHSPLCPHAHKGAGESDAGAADEGLTVTTGRYQKEAGRNREVNLKCLGDADEDGSDGDGDSGDGPVIPILSAGGSLGYRDGGGLIQHTDSHITEPLGSHHTSDTHSMVIDHTGGTNKG